jgi:hypothetical protein
VKIITHGKNRRHGGLFEKSDHTCGSSHFAMINKPLIALVALLGFAVAPLSAKDDAKPDTEQVLPEKAAVDAARKAVAAARNELRRNPRDRHRQEVVKAAQQKEVEAAKAYREARKASDDAKETAKQSELAEKKAAAAKEAEKKAANK